MGGEAGGGEFDGGRCRGPRRAATDDGVQRGRGQCGIGGASRVAATGAARAGPAEWWAGTLACRRTWLTSEAISKSLASRLPTRCGSSRTQVRAGRQRDGSGILDDELRVRLVLQDSGEKFVERRLAAAEQHRLRVGQEQQLASIELLYHVVHRLGLDHLHVRSRELVLVRKRLGGEAELGFLSRPARGPNP